MNTRDLIELSQLDALGLLDEQEREEFDAAFAAASPAIQAQLRSEQSRTVKTDWIACDAQPPEGLREAVLGEMSLALRVADMRQRVLGAIHTEIVRRPVHQHGAHVHPAGRSHPLIYPVRRVSRLWRAATLGFAAAAVTFAGTTLYLKNQYQEVDRQARENAMVADLVATPGLRIKQILFDKNTERRLFSQGERQSSAQASLYITKDSPLARLYVSGLPESKPGIDGKDYRVVVLTDDGQIGQELAKFSSDGRMKAYEVEIDISQHKHLAIVETRTGSPAQEGSILLKSEALA